MKKIILFCLYIFPPSLFALDESCPQPIDVVVALDSSGSLLADYNGTYAGWKFEIDRAKEIFDLHDVGFGKTNVAVTNSSGCGSSVTYSDCVEDRGRFITELALSDDFSAISSLLTYDSADDTAGLGSPEFLQGTSWTDWGLYHAKEQLAGSSQTDPRQVIILFSDKEPYPESHKLCDEEGFVSDSLQGIRDAGIDLFIVKLQDDEQSDACAVSEADHVNVKGSFISWGEFLTHYQARITANPDNDDLCGDADICPNDAENDFDSDAICGDLDNDDDNDGVTDDVDDCPLGIIGSGNAPIGSDIDEDGCEAAEDNDDDGDGINDIDDANPNIAIGDLIDNDNDGAPDSCVAVDCLGMAEDNDDDNDGVVDVVTEEVNDEVVVDEIADIEDSLAAKDEIDNVENLDVVDNRKSGGDFSSLSSFMLLIFLFLIGAMRMKA